MQVINSEDIKSILVVSLFQRHRMEMESLGHGQWVVPPIWHPAHPSSPTSHSKELGTTPCQLTMVSRSLPKQDYVKLRISLEKQKALSGCVCFSSDLWKALQASLSSARKKSLLPSLCTHGKVIEDWTSVGAEESFCQHWINIQLPCQQESTPQNQHPQSAQYFLLGLGSQLPLGLQAIMEHSSSSSYSLSCIAIYRSKSVSLMFQSMKYSSMHNQSCSALLKVPKCFKSASWVEHWANIQPERAVVARRVWQSPRVKRCVLLPSRQVLEKVLFDPSATGMSSGRLMCCKDCNTS